MLWCLVIIYWNYIYAALDIFLDFQVRPSKFASTFISTVQDQELRSGSEFWLNCVFCMQYVMLFVPTRLSCLHFSAFLSEIKSQLRGERMVCLTKIIYITRTILRVGTNNENRCIFETPYVIGFAHTYNYPYTGNSLLMKPTYERRRYTCNSASHWLVA